MDGIHIFPCDYRLRIQVFDDKPPLCVGVSVLLSDKVKIIRLAMCDKSDLIADSVTTIIAAGMLGS